MLPIDWTKTDLHKQLVKFISILSIIFVCCVSCQYCNRYFDLQDDWAGEEVVEQLIENQTGIDVDLTPASPEK